MDESIIAGRLYETADFAARIRGYKFNSGAESEMRERAMIAAHNIAIHPVSKTNLPGLVKIGELTFEYFVEEMMKSSEIERSLDPEFPSIIGTHTIRDSILRFCPMWPIC
ncbi:MAG: hypothetical protein J0I57_02595 [Hyphomicrobium sp.]|uniref:hypothetical protein n=1 Tax=Hyphomicrobium sp. CS1BSMeth3 TaxID=1892844 RepID=UPI000931B80B|nr:hypothetical protein [Hyphomicrobium sp. CS1BSMeth3]MBN9265935.1 hypothetical protein [Hyphomicrobium sp.]MBN9276510.1 hypothetical protein [Hyphomicrobium sp.]OJU22414.1 MAG: hypothetical protein BGN89_09480 [Alphaproteobacteria bacterium 64-6]